MPEFLLSPFPPDILHHNLTISGAISRCDRLLSLHYELTGNLEQLAIPPLVNQPNRKRELWQETCFEFFLKPHNSSQYWEFNLSPSGHWNIYHFQDYREGMKEEIKFMILPFLIREENNRVSLNIELNLDAIASPDRVLEVAISTVIKFKNGDLAYYALTHPQKQADFHHQDSFVIQL